MSYLNYVQIMKKFIESRLLQGINTFTHKDIIRETNTNCPYSVLKYLKNYYDIDFKNEVSRNRKHDSEGNIKYVNTKFRKYIILKRKDKNVQKPCVW